VWYAAVCVVALCKRDFFYVLLNCKCLEHGNSDSGNGNQELSSVRNNMSERRRQRHHANQAQASQPQPSAPPASVDIEQQREELINASMFYREIDRPESVRSLETVLKIAQDRYDADSEGNIISRSWRAASSSVRTTGERECIICLDTYEPGDTICWAKSTKCDHIFHGECAKEWLKNHEDCPLCRTKILGVAAS
jgi:hypothetical protein